MKFRLLTIIFLGFALLWISGCTKAPPNRIENICSIFRQYPEWYWEAERVEKKWGLPISVLMAIIYQESRFQARAKPPREKLLWIIPWKRPTSAYGYSQAINATWQHYKRDTGKFSASRNAFDDAADFIGWYTNLTHERTGISKDNAYSVYLAYHEGITNFSNKTYEKKTWLMSVARKVQRRGWTYRYQLSTCRNSLPQKPWWRIW